MEIRERHAKDVSSLECLAQDVHERDGYPIYLPTDLREFLVGSASHGAWVAEQDGNILGHVALHRRSWTGVMELACQAIGLAEENLAVVARLLVAPDVRRRGVGRRLLGTAASTAHNLGLCPILDVAVRNEAANRLYHEEGWRCLGSVPFPMPDGTTVEEYVYVGPTVLDTVRCSSAAGR